MCSISLSEIDPSIYKNTRHFHVSGISMAISKNLRTTVIELIKRFKEQGASVSFDCNYRAKLWSEEEARRNHLLCTSLC